MKRLKIWWLKRQARSAYLEYLSALDEVDCGPTVALMLRSVSSPAYRFDRLLDRLAQLGEDVPEGRLTR